MTDAPPAAQIALRTPGHGLTPELARALVKAAGQTPHVEQIAFSCGVTPATLLHWLQLGLDGKGEGFVEFTRRFFEAESRALKRQIRLLERELKGNPIARLQYIKYRFGDGESAGTRPNEALSRMIRQRQDKDRR